MLKLGKHVKQILYYNQDYPDNEVAWRGIRKLFRDYIRSSDIPEDSKAILIEGLLDTDTIDV